MKPCILETPYAGEVADNVAFARRCMRALLFEGYAPFASHLLYPQPGILDDNDPEERKMGIEAGLAWRTKHTLSMFYTDRGWSKGMLYALHTACNLRYPFEIRGLVYPATLPVTHDEDMERYIKAHLVMKVGS